MHKRFMVSGSACLFSGQSDDVALGQVVKSPVT